MKQVKDMCLVRKMKTLKTMKIGNVAVKSKVGKQNVEFSTSRII